MSRNVPRGKSLGGFAWHTTYLKNSTEEPKRDRRMCIYYCGEDQCEKGQRCFSSRYCLEYERKEKNTTKKKTPKQKVISRVIDGYFKVKFLSDNEEMFFEVGKNIKPDTQMVNAVLTAKVGEVFNVNDEKVLLISKELVEIKEYA